MDESGMESAPPQTSEFDDPDLFREQPKWPKVIGIISIIIGALGLTCMGIGAVLVPLQFGVVEGMLEGDPPPPTMQFGVVDYALLAGSLGTSVLLLVAGIMTVMRKPAGRSLHLVYGVIGIPITFVSVWNQSVKNAGVEQWLQDYPNNELSKAMSSGGAAGQEIGAFVGLAFTILLGLGIPLFYLIWFGLIKTKPDAMTGGVEADVY